MILRYGALIALFLQILPVRAQLDDYKYIVVPKQFEAFKQPNQYQTSTMVKYFLSQKGLPAIWNDARPPELATEPCKALFARLADDSNMLVTKVRIRLVDCGDTVVFETGEGRSKIKDFKGAYREAIEEAMKSFDGVNYTYRPPAQIQQDPTPPPPVTRKPVPIPQPPTTSDRIPKRVSHVVPEPETSESEPESASEALQESVPETAANQIPEPVPEQQAQPPGDGLQDPQALPTDLLYAQETEDGYQLVDQMPSVRMQLLRTSRPDTFIALVGGQPKGTVFKDGERWIHEFYQEGTLVRQPLSIRFY